MFYLGRQNRDKIGRFLHDTRQIFVGRFCRQIKSADFVDRLTSPLVIMIRCAVD